MSVSAAEAATPTDPVWNNEEDEDQQQHAALLERMERLYKELPDGWIPNPETGNPGQHAPFLHPASGRESFQHPNRAQLDAIVQEYQAASTPQRQTTTTTGTTTNDPALSRQVKKLRMMLQTGIPLPAVEQKAQLDGVDMALVLQQNKENSVGNNTTNTIPPPLLKKYRRMLKSGIPLGAVQTMAMVEGNWSADVVQEALRDVLETTGSSTTTTTTTKQTMDEDDEPEGISHRCFVPNTHNQVSFPSGDTKDPNVLAHLVRKMVLTVQKRAATNAHGSMVVGSDVLYNALGALRGVQVSRDRYRQASSSCNSSLWQRQGFMEIARSIGLELPKEDNAVSVDIIPGLDELVRFIEYQHRDALQDHAAMRDSGWYTFDGLALLYPPGATVVAKHAGGGGIDVLCQVAWNRYEQGRTIMGQPMKYFKFCVQYVAAVGASHATLAEVVEGMELFTGRREVQSALQFVPLACYTPDQQAAIVERYRQRGQLFQNVALRGRHALMKYDKGSFFLKRGSAMENSNSATALATGGRVIVDTQGAYDHGHSLGFGYDPMVLGIKYKYKEYSLFLRSNKNGDGSGDSGGSTDGSMVLFDQVPEEYLPMVWPLVVGFSLTAKAWGDVLLDGLGEIQWQEDIFERLVLPDNRKMMVKALVRHSTNSFQDLVQGKGEGTIFLMYGPPGVGKTLTAEAVAELLHKPLYSVSLGTLGSTPQALEEKLGQIMNLSARWDALILLDEADSFLEARSSTSSLERNAMVSVMLKLVEYFSGILFLTSNRMDSLDPAFQTRITLALRYENLTAAGCTQVWRNLLLKSGFAAAMEDGTIDPLALGKAQLNGREIKNALRLAMAFSAEKEQVLSQAILMETIAIVTDYKTAIASTSAVEDDIDEGVC